MAMRRSISTVVMPTSSDCPFSQRSANFIVSAAYWMGCRTAAPAGNVRFAFSTSAASSSPIFETSAKSFCSSPVRPISSGLMSPAPPCTNMHSRPGSAASTRACNTPG